MTAQILHTVNQRLSLRVPQAESLFRLAHVVNVAPALLNHQRDAAPVLSSLQPDFATLEDFEHELPSLCFTLVTDVGKTRLMGAFVTYPHLAHGINNFFMFTPNLTIYNKLISEFTPNTPNTYSRALANLRAIHQSSSPAMITIRRT